MAPKLVSLLLITIFIRYTATMTMGDKVGEEGGATSWCVARSDASNQALQRALDYACGVGGADCNPIQSNGLCYLPNTLQAHASYAFNSFYQLKARAPGSCDFSATSTIAKTDPSYGSCVYPSSVSTAGGTTNSPITTSPNVSTTTSTPMYGGGDASGLSPGMNIPPIPDNSGASSKATITISSLVSFSTLLIMSLTSLPVVMHV